MSNELARAKSAAGRALRRGRVHWRRMLSDDLVPAAPTANAENDAAHEQVAALSAEVARLRADQAAHGTWLSDLQAGVGDIREAYGTQLDDHSKWLGSAILTLSSLSTTPVVTSPQLQGAAPAAVRVDELAILRRQLQVWAVRAFLQALPDQFDLLISIVMPTRNRGPFLRQAITSVFNQRHQNFELIVINDGSEDDTAEFLAAIDDRRVKVIRTPGLGEPAARNLGLAAATGSIITFLDDDNLMDPGWLYALAWAFTRWPETQVLYGARVIEDAQALNSTPSGALPHLDWEVFDRRRLEQGNYIDMNTIAMRPGLDGCHFDETLRSSIDWQLMLDLSARYTPFELPAVACLYRTYAPNRICDDPVRLDHNRRVRARVHRTRAMRVLSHNAMFPLLSETYIHEEMLSLQANGAEIAFNSVQVPQSPMVVDAPVSNDLYQAVHEFDPDVVFVYWATHAAGELTNLERIGRPFALRVHSFDFDPEAIARIQAHPLCIGVWAYPHHVAALPGAHGLVPLFATHDAMGATDGSRDLALSVSAGLPKKNWPLLLEAMDQITDLERGIVLARSNGLEEVPDHVIELAAQLDTPPFVQVNLKRSAVFTLLGRTSVMLYTLDEGLPIGMPMSLIEALRAGACVVHPDRPELRHTAGPGFRGYVTVDDIVAHVREITAGGAAIDAERQANESWARSQFCDPALATAFHEELSSALERWRYDVA